MTSSTGWSGLILSALPPMRFIASRIAARSTTAGTPVKSCSSTRLGVKAISRSGSAVGFHFDSASMSSGFTETPFSVRSRFSTRIFSENGSRSIPGSFFAATSSL